MGWNFMRLILITNYKTMPFKKWHVWDSEKKEFIQLPTEEKPLIVNDALVVNQEVVDKHIEEKYERNESFKDATNVKQFVELLWLEYSTEFRNALFRYFKIDSVAKYWFIWWKMSVDALLQEMRLAKEEEILSIYEPFKPKK